MSAHKFKLPTPSILSHSTSKLVTPSRQVTNEHRVHCWASPSSFVIATKQLPSVMFWTTETSSFRPSVYANVTKYVVGSPSLLKRNPYSSLLAHIVASPLQDWHVEESLQDKSLPSSSQLHVVSLDGSSLKCPSSCWYRDASIWQFSSKLSEQTRWMGSQHRVQHWHSRVGKEPPQSAHILVNKELVSVLLQNAPNVFASSLRPVSRMSRVPEMQIVWKRFRNATLLYANTDIVR